METTTHNIAVGASKIANIKLGSVDILRAYLGSTLLFYNAVTPNFIIGYRPIEKEDTTLAPNHVIVTNNSELQNAIWGLAAGQTVYVRNGNYKLAGEMYLNAQGTSTSPITIRNYPNEHPTLTGTPVTFASGCKYINLEGFVLKDLTQLDWGHCVRIANGCSYINIRNNEITNVTCKTVTPTASNGCNPLVLYGDHATNSIHHCIIENNYIHDCDTGWSEALTLNGNVEYCTIRRNTVHDTNNIGIDFAGNYQWTGTVGDANNQTRHCVAEQNLIYNCNSPYATSAGLYCDGSRDNTFQYNIVAHSQCGIELGGEEGGSPVQNFHILGNLIIDCCRCIGAGAYLATGAKHQNVYVYNNTFIGGTYYPEENTMVMLERTDNVFLYNNIFYAQDGMELLYNPYGATVTGDYNCWYRPSGATKPKGEGTHSFVGDPKFKNNTNTKEGDYTLQSGSPCLDKGKHDPTHCGEYDLNGNPRVKGTIDIGCYEN